MADEKKALDILFNELPDAEAAFDAAPEIPHKLSEPEEGIGTDITDITRGLGQGLTLGFSDELAGGAQALYDVATKKDKSLKDLKDLYSKYQNLEQQKLKQSQERSPYLYGLSEMAGAVAPAAAGVVTGVLPAISTSSLGSIGRLAAKEALKKGLTKELAKDAASSAIKSEIARRGIGSAILGGAQAAGSTEAGISSEPKDFIKEVATGAGVGGTFGVALPSAISKIGKTGSALADKMTINSEQYPLVSQLKKSFNLGRSGVPVNETEHAINRMAAEEAADTSLLTQQFLDAKDTLGRAIKQRVVDATNEGVEIPIRDTVVNNINDLDKLLTQNKIAFSNSAIKDIINKLQFISKGENPLLNPLEIRTLKQQLNDLFWKTDSPDVKSIIRSLQTDLTGVLEEQVPGLKQLNQKYSDFLRLGPETILSRGMDPAHAQVRWSDINKPHAALASAIEELTSELRVPGIKKMPARKMMDSLSKNLTELEKTYPGILDETGIGSVENLNKFLIDAGDRAAIAKQVLRFDPQASPIKTVMGIVSKIVPLDRGELLAKANLLGRQTKALSGTFSRKFTTASDPEMMTYIQKLKTSTNPIINQTASSLEKALQEKNTVAKNAAMFVLLQNPEARKMLRGYIGDEDEETTGGELK